MGCEMEWMVQEYMCVRVHVLTCMCMCVDLSAYDLYGWVHS